MWYKEKKRREKERGKPVCLEFTNVRNTSSTTAFNLPNLQFLQEQGIKHVKTTLWKELMTTTIYFHIQVELDF